MPYSDETTHVIFEPFDFIGKLVALVPKPRVNLTRFHGVFAPNSKHHVDVTLAKQGRGHTRQGNEDNTPAKLHKAIMRAQSLNRVFSIPAF
jgi:hypothetical protein